MVSSLLSFIVAYLGAKSTGTFKLHLGEIKVITFLIDYIHTFKIMSFLNLLEATAFGTRVSEALKSCF